MNQRNSLGNLDAIQERLHDAEECRMSFIQGTPRDFSALSPHVYQGWLRSRQLMIDPDTVVFESGKTEPFSLDITADDVFEPSFLKERFLVFSELLSTFGAAILFLDTSLRIVGGGGNEILLDELAAKGVVSGACLQEKYVGSNAVSVAQKTRKQSLLLGHEHYCKALCEYAAFADCIEIGAAQSLKHPCFVQIVIPLEHFSESFAQLCSYCCEEARASSDLRYQPQAKLQLCLLEAMSEISHTMRIIVDNNDIVIDVDEKLCELYANSREELCGQNAYTMMPEHSHLFGRVKKGETIQNYNYLCKAQPIRMSDKEFYMTLFPFFEDPKNKKGYLGFACTIIHAQSMRNNVNKLVNLDAHFTFSDLVGGNEDFTLIKELAVQAANSKSNVYLCGENGTGKEMFAQAIHNGSDRCDNPFITVNCAALPKESIGKVLFGYVNGEASEGVAGKFEQANEGTLFLDEISEMPLDMQAVLLKTLEEKRVTRLGDNESRKVDVRIITATDCDLAELVKVGRFRLDLYYRINVVHLDIPPLRNRVADIPLLAHFFLGQFSSSLNRNISSISEGALDRMCSYSWPGNIRELQNVIERCVNTCKSREISENLLPPEIRSQQNQSSESSVNEMLDTTKTEQGHLESYDERESEGIKALMKKHKGNKTAVASELGITRATLYRKLKKISQW